MDEHPQQGNLNAPLICGYAKSIGRRLKPRSLYQTYDNYKKGLFTKLVAASGKEEEEEEEEERTQEEVPEEDKQKIKELLKKPWNPYIRRHSALTEKSVILKENILRQYARWSIRSQMPQKYLHYFGNESSESILQAYGIVTTEKQVIDKLRPKQCPNCNEPNKPDSRFCAKCRMVLTYDAYNETRENAQQKDDEIKTIKEQIQALILAVNNMKDQNQINNFAEHTILGRNVDEKLLSKINIPTSRAGAAYHLYDLAAEEERYEP